MRQPWHTVAQNLVDVAMGRTPAECVVRDGRWVNVHTREVIDHIDIAIHSGRIAYVGPDAEYCIGEQTTVIDANNAYLVPGLSDAHMHHILLRLSCIRKK